MGFAVPLYYLLEILKTEYAMLDTFKICGYNIDKLHRTLKNMYVKILCGK